MAAVRENSHVVELGGSEGALAFRVQLTEAVLDAMRLEPDADWGLEFTAANKAVRGRFVILCPLPVWAKTTAASPALAGTLFPSFLCLRFSISFLNLWSFFHGRQVFRSGEAKFEAGVLTIAGQDKGGPMYLLRELDGDLQGIGMVEKKISINNELTKRCINESSLPHGLVLPLELILY